jgi:hypothetical protein
MFGQSRQQFLDLLLSVIKMRRAAKAVLANGQLDAVFLAQFRENLFVGKLG